MNRHTFRKIKKIAAALNKSETIFAYNSISESVLSKLERLEREIPEVSDVACPEIAKNKIPHHRVFHTINAKRWSENTKEQINDILYFGQPDFWAGWAQHRANQYSDSVEDIYIRKFTKKKLEQSMQTIYSMIGNANNLSLEDTGHGNIVLPSMSYGKMSTIIKNNASSRNMEAPLFDLMKIKEINFERESVSFFDYEVGYDNYFYFEVYKYINKLLLEGATPVLRMGNTYLYNLDFLTFLLMILFSLFPGQISLNDPLEDIEAKIKMINRHLFGTISNYNIYYLCSTDPVIHRLMTMRITKIMRRRNKYGNEYVYKYEDQRKIFSELTNKDFFSFESVYERPTEDMITLIKPIISPRIGS